MSCLTLRCHVRSILIGTKVVVLTKDFIARAFVVKYESCLVTVQHTFDSPGKNSHVYVPIKATRWKYWSTQLQFWLCFWGSDQHTKRKISLRGLSLILSSNRVCTAASVDAYNIILMFWRYFGLSCFCILLLVFQSHRHVAWSTWNTHRTSVAFVNTMCSACYFAKQSSILKTLGPVCPLPPKQSDGSIDLHRSNSAGHNRRLCLWGSNRHTKRQISLTGVLLLLSSKGLYISLCRCIYHLCCLIFLYSNTGVP